jgi:hypothetical protein
MGSARNRSKVAGDHRPCEEAEISFGNLRTCAVLAEEQDSYRTQAMEVLNASTVVAVPELGCAALENVEQMAGNIAVIRRGDCDFAEKASNAQAAGAVAVVITNNRIEAPWKMVGDFSAVTIPAMMITQDAGAELRGNSGRACAIAIGTRSVIDAATAVARNQTGFCRHQVRV